MNPPPRTLGVQSKFRTLIKKKKKEEARIQRGSTFLLRCYCNREGKGYEKGIEGVDNVSNRSCIRYIDSILQKKIL